jgi:hypothetical protein
MRTTIPVNADSFPDSTLVFTLRVSPVFRVRLWLATVLIWLAGQLVGMEVEIEHRPQP